MNTPDSQTSNYGWALWHLSEAESAGSAAAAQVHATCAAARATLAAVDEASGDHSGGSVWEMPK